MTRPAFDNGAAWRAATVVNFLVLPFMLVWAVLMHGLPVLWEDLPSELKRMGKTLWTGRPGPHDGVIW
jgi:hypothetical protein